MGRKKDNRPENLRAVCPECYEGNGPNNNGNMLYFSIKKIFKS